jgi:hypothetical protein
MGTTKLAIDDLHGDAVPADEVVAHHPYETLAALAWEEGRVVQLGAEALEE